VLGAISICTSAYRLRIAQVRRREVELQRLLAQGAKELQERKRVEAELRRSEDKFAKAFHSSPASMGISSPETGRLIDVNKSFLELFGFQRNEVIGHTASELGIWADPAEREQVIAMLRQQGTVHNLKTRLRNRAGKILDASISAEIVSFGGEECLLVVTLDVTQQRRLEDQLRQAQKMEAIGNLAGGVAHDFNNLLNIISGYTELMLYQLPTDTPLHAHAQNIRGASDKAASLTRQLLAFSRKQMVSLKVLELDSVLREAGELLPRLIAEDIELSIRSAPEARVRIDPVQIQQIIFNLAVNARDAMPTGGHLIIETRCLELNGDFSIQQLPCPAGRYVLLSVCDTGVGIPEDMQPHIFEPFFTSKEQGKGTGLGLATVYGIVQQAGGGISVHSEPGAGTTFKIYLPSVEEPLEPAVPEYSEESLRGTETILLVEDQTELRSLMSVFLENQGYTVIQASRPSEALELIGERKQEIDLLLTDVVMPGMHGPELAQRVRRLYPQIKILFVSGYAPDRFDNKLHGDFALLQKPIGLKALSQKLREALTSDGSVKFYEQDSDASAA
jgi:PAS domain S-box-containing protein